MQYLEHLKDLAIDAVVLFGTWFFITFCGMMGHVHGFLSCAGDTTQATQVEKASSP